MGIEVSESLILKYLEKRMREKSFSYTSMIVNILRERNFPR